MIRAIVRDSRLALTTWVILFHVGTVAACPFCSAVSMTLSEEMNAADLALLVKLESAETPPTDTSADAQASPTPDAEAKTVFTVIEALKGAEHVAGLKQIDVLYFGPRSADTVFLVMGNDPPSTSYSTPIPLTERAIAYARELPKLPPSGGERLVFFQGYFEDEEDLLARDAFDEFARAPYADLKAMKDRMHHDKLVAWVGDSQVTASRRRLYLTMLGVCGGPDDVAMLEGLIASNDRDTKTALDAMIACYLTLKGPDGMPLVEELFLKKADAEYTDTYATIMALRFHGQEEQIIPKERLLEAMRHMLDRPQLADLVIPDLARWQDWTVVDRLVTLFKEADDESSWVRVPVVNYLRACPLPEAKERIDELAQIDPDAVKRAQSFFPFPAAAPPVPAPASEAVAATDSTSPQPTAPSDVTLAGTASETEPAAAPAVKAPPEESKAAETPVVEGAQDATSRATDKDAEDAISTSQPRRATTVITPPAPHSGPVLAVPMIAGGAIVVVLALLAVIFYRG